MTYGMISNAMSCKNLWQYPGGPKAGLGYNIGEYAGGGGPHRYIGWVYRGDTHLTQSPISATAGMSNGGDAGACVRHLKQSIRRSPTSDTLAKPGAPEDMSGSSSQQQFDAHYQLVRPETIELLVR